MPGIMVSSSTRSGWVADSASFNARSPLVATVVSYQTGLSSAVHEREILWRVVDDQHDLAPHPTQYLASYWIPPLEFHASGLRRA